LDEKIKQMREYFSAQEELRETLLDLTRETIRASARAIAAMHRGDGSAPKFLGEARKKLLELRKLTKDNPSWKNSGIVLSAYQEYGEAEVFSSLLKGGKFLFADELKIPYRAYLSALTDVAGELRRHVLDLIREDRVEEAKQMLKRMEEIFEILMDFDYPDAILPGMKRRQDVVRNLVERTRGDLTLAVRQQKLEKVLKSAERHK
jgi:translin